MVVPDILTDTVGKRQHKYPQIATPANVDACTRPGTLERLPTADGTRREFLTAVDHSKQIPLVCVSIFLRSEWHQDTENSK